mgnify:CR=1 FL=1
MSETNHVIVIGAGAAGMLAAIAAAREGAAVELWEQNEKPGKKLFITGKGRCNVTNACDMEELLGSVVSNSKFLYSSFYGFTNQDMMDLLEQAGLRLKVGRGNRVFPQSDKSSDVISALSALLRQAGVRVCLNQKAEGLAVEEGVCKGVRCGGRIQTADRVIVATGGLSYPATGSTGDGYKLARQAGHTLVEPVPSLVSLVSHDADCKKMMGLALKNVTLTLHEDGKPIFEEQGEMLFTHFGISGPLTLSASSHLGDMKKHKYHAEIDLKPALSEEQLYDRITRDFALLANHAAQGALVKLLPSSMQPVMVARWGIDPATKANQITREQKRELVQLIKHWRVSIDARGDLAHAVITSGGVSVREVDPKTMQSKKALGLYFAGEVLDVDAYTGGYNLQIAFCTAQSFANHLE